MQPHFCPRLSEAKTLLPTLRAQLVAAAPRYSLPAGVCLELLPIAEDGLFGYELVPDRHTNTYFTLGFGASGEPALRRTESCPSAPSLLRLATRNGKSVVGTDLHPRQQQSDTRFDKVSDAVDSLFSQLAAIFPEKPRKTIELRVDVHRYLDEVLAIAHEHLSDWDPYVHFFGLPNEAQYGFALRGDRGEHGELASRRPDMWVLRWRSPEAVMYEEWAVLLPDLNATMRSAPA
jgi:hypothetical protein